MTTSEARDEALGALHAALSAAAAARVELSTRVAEARTARAAREAAEDGVVAFERALLRLGEAALDAHQAGVLAAPAVAAVPEAAPADSAAAVEPAVAAAPAAEVSTASPEVASAPAPSPDRAVVLSRPDSAPPIAPAPAPRVAAPRAKADLSPAKLAALQDRLNGGGSLKAGVAPGSDPSRSVWARLGPVPETIPSTAAFAAEFNQLRSHTEGSRPNAWRALPQATQVTLVEYLAARLRRLQAEVSSALRPPHAVGDNAFQVIIGDLAAYLTAERPGFAYGLARVHEPRAGTWLRDAQDLAAALDGRPKPGKPSSSPTFNTERALDALRGLLAAGVDDATLKRQVRDMLKQGASHLDPRLNDLLADEVDRLVGPDLSRLRAACRRFVRAQQAGDDDAGGAAIWVQDATLAGKRVVLVGGDRQSQCLQRLQACLPSVTLEWLESSVNGGVRLAQSLIESINYGNVDVVLLVQRFLSHKISNALVEAARVSPAGVRIATVRRGYGLSQIRLALERALDQTQAE